MMKIVSSIYHKWDKNGYFARFKCSNCGKIVERKLPCTVQYCSCRGSKDKKLKRRQIKKNKWRTL